MNYNSFLEIFKWKQQTNKEYDFELLTLTPFKMQNSNLDVPAAIEMSYGPSNGNKILSQSYRDETGLIFQIV